MEYPSTTRSWNYGLKTAYPDDSEKAPNILHELYSNNAFKLEKKNPVSCSECIRQQANAEWGRRRHMTSYEMLSSECIQTN